MKLILLPYAGAHVNVFAGLQKQLQAGYPELTVLSLEYPGHGRRFSGRPLSSIREITADLLSTLRQSLDPGEELMLLGYSMGSLIAYELAHALLDSGYPVSRLLFMAATPPHRIEAVDEEEPDDDALLERCRIYGLIKEGQFDSRQMRELFLPALRSDITAVNRYNLDNQYRCRRFGADVRIAVFQGLEDRSVTAVQNWGDLSGQEVSLHTYPGGHFFYYEFEQQVYSHIISFITAGQTSRFKGGNGQ
ncbi:thioesterase II family protein [Paenibacillus typhae]|uniref:Surfactin synthase thioesterase subunit n=1 Tax=Paenibacillus typhae TaxID=1174501 RepID=A0A1G8ICX8_9BACL|nr:alpha/beta fold hydrolase [Paenibacillus typhae]SDI16868.1 Surfactin synthase thioesterase subunit [Paenibacillus typhae]